MPKIYMVAYKRTNTQKKKLNWRQLASRTIQTQRICRLQKFKSSSTLKTKQKTNAHERRDSISLISYAGCLGLSPVMSAQFIFEMCVAAWNPEKNN